MINLAPLILLFPLLGFVATGLFGRSYPREAHRFAMAGVIASWVVASIVAAAALSHGFGFGDHGTGITLWHWIPAGSGFSAPISAERITGSNVTSGGRAWRTKPGLLLKQARR